MPRTKGSKNKNVNTAKNKNIININVNSSKSKRGRPRKTTANTNTQNRPQTSGGGISMAPPQVIISQPQADNSNNSLLSSFLSSKMLNETMSLNRTVEPPRAEPTRAEPSFFTARESMIPKLPETPISRPPKIFIKPSPEIESVAPPLAEPPKIKVKPADVAPPEKETKPIDVTPSKKTTPKFYKKLGDNKTDAASQFSSSILEDAMKDINKEDKAATAISSAFRGHKGRLNYTYIKKYPELVNKRLEQVKQMDPQNLLQYLPKTGDKGEPLHIQKLKEKLAKEEKRRINDKGKLEKSLSENTISQDLENKTLKNKAAIKLQNAFRVRKAINTVADKYIDKQNKAATKIQGIVRGVKTRNKLNTDEQFQNRIDMKIKKYGDAASEFATRGKDSKKVNEEFSDIVKKMRTGLKDYKTTLGIQPKKRGPKSKVNDF
jgi:hypothetical protein